MTSVNTNYGALLALQSLNKTNNELSEVQGRITTGLKVASAKDNGAVFAIAESQRARVGALTQVRDGIDRASAAIDFGVAAGEAINDILKQARDKAVASQGPALSDDDRAKLQTDFAKLIGQIDSIADGATYNGVNLANGSNTGGNGLAVQTTDRASGAAGGGFYITGGAGDTAVTGALTLDTELFGTAGIGIIGLDAADTDTFRIRLFGADGVVGGTDNQTINVSLAAGDTVEDFVNKVNTAAGGQLTASFANGRITYTSTQAFDATFTDDATNTDDAAAVEQIFSGAATTVANAAVRYQPGGGYQSSTAALATGTTENTVFAELEATDNDDEAISFTFGSGTTQRVFNVSFDGVGTLGDYLSKVSSATNGLVTASYDTTTRTINYRSDEQFTVAAVGTISTAANFVPATATAQLAPSGAGTSGGSGTSRVEGYDFRLGRGALQQVTSTLSIATSTGASNAVAAIDHALSGLRENLATLGSQSKALDTQKNFLQKLSDTLDNSIGRLVDADLAKESARLQSLQVKQQLGAQSLSIANQTPQILLSFFR